MSLTMSEVVAQTLVQIEKYPSLEDWWRVCVLTPFMKTFVPEILALILIEGGILYTRNWLAALLCFFIIISKVYRIFIALSTTLMHGFLILQTRESYLNGIAFGVNQERERADALENSRNTC
jgi:hypothetical protein